MPRTAPPAPLRCPKITTAKMFAHGQGLIPLLLIGFPAALIGVVCLVMATFLPAKEKTDGKSRRKRLALVGGSLLLFALISPSLDRVVIPIMDWIVGH